MSEQAQVEIIFSAGGQFYAVTGAGCERHLWLGVDKHPLPVPLEWHRPGLVCACVMRGRSYYRIAAFGPQHSGGSKSVSIDDELVKDYRDAAWWTPGLEEAWVELQGLREAFNTLGEAERSRAHQWSEAERAGESASCVTRKASAACAPRSVSGAHKTSQK